MANKMMLLPIKTLQVKYRGEPLFSYPVHFSKMCIFKAHMEVSKLQHA